jgi:uncharacterized membrane protein HdeD (DUF308 family)
MEAMSSSDRAVLENVSRMWWVWLGVGIFWTIAAVVILQFDQASINTVGVLIGIMFAFASVQQFVLFSMADRMRWLFAIFGVLFAGAAVATFISPENTFAAIADMLGFLFLLVGIYWLIEAFAVKEINPLWWLGLVAGILMVILAFWTGGQFFIEKAYVLLVFAGIWALLQGVTDVVRAFQIRKLGEMV